MTDKTNTPSADMTQVMHSIGQLTGAVKAMHEGTTARIEDIRRDIARLELATQGQLQAVETRLSKQITEQGEAVNKRVDSVVKRVEVLEAEDKRLIDKVARVSAIGGTVSGVLTAGVIEVIKRMGH